MSGLVMQETYCCGTGRAVELQIWADALGGAQHRMIVGHLVQGPIHRLAPEPGHGPRIGAVDQHRG